jgi:hypothetical protein
LISIIYPNTPTVKECLEALRIIIAPMPVVILLESSFLHKVATLVN